MKFITEEKLTIVGAAGMIGSNMAQTALMMHLTPNICLYDPFAPALEGVVEELLHCGFEGVNITYTSDIAEALTGAKYIVSSGGAARKAGNKVKDKYGPLSFRHFVLGAVAIFFYVGIEVGIPNIANLYMTTPTVESAQKLVADYEFQQDPANAEFLARIEAEDKANADNEDYAPQVVAESSYERAQGVLDGSVKEGRGLTAKLAGVLIGIYWFLMMCGRLIGGAIGGRVSSRRMLAVVSSMAMIFVLCIMFIPRSAVVEIPFIEGVVPVNMVFMVLCGLCTSVMWGGIFNLAAEGLGKYTPAASGIFMTLVCGGGILPFLQGGIADMAGYMTSYWLVFGCLCYLLFYALAGSKNVNKDIKTE